MKTKSIVRNIFFSYVICQILCNIYFMCFPSTFQTQSIFWILTILGSIFWGLKVYSYQLSQIFHLPPDKYLLIKIFFCFQINSIPFLMYFSFASMDNINSIWLAAFQVLHLPEFILMEILTQGIYYLECIFSQNLEYVLHDTYSVYPFTAMLILVEIYFLAAKQKNVAMA